MRIYGCDRCGRRFAQSGPGDPPPKPSDTSIANGITTRLPTTVGEKDGQVEFREYDLCPKCIRSLGRWLSNQSE